MFSKDSTIGIIGLGIVGDALRHHFESLSHQVRVFDGQRGAGSLHDINQAELVFVCVPTSYQSSSGFDARALEDAVSLLDSSKVIVITSNVLPGTTEAFQCRYPQHCFLVNPQFSASDARRPDRQLAGYTAQSRHLAEAVLALLPAAPYHRVLPSREAELARYITSAFLATKLVLGGEARDLCAALDADYAAVRDALAEGFDIDGDRAAAAALTTDANALLSLAAGVGVSLPLLRTAAEINASSSVADESLAVQPPLDGRWLQDLAPDPDTGKQAA